MSLEKFYRDFQGKKCLKKMKGYSEDIAKSLDIVGISRQCLDFDRSIKECRKRNSHQLSGQTTQTWEIILQTRDNILYQLNLLWSLYHSLVAKDKQSQCPSFSKFCQSLCAEGPIVQTLATCLESSDHFIAFQAHKVLRKIVQWYPGIVVHAAFQEMILGFKRVTEECGKWRIVYTVEILKEILNHGTGFTDLHCRKEKLSKTYSSNCDCQLEEHSQLVTDFSETWKSLNYYWLDLMHKCLTMFMFPAKDAPSEIRPNRESVPIVLQQTLGSLLFLGSILMKSYQNSVNRRIFQSKDVANSSSKSLDSKFSTKYIFSGVNVFLHQSSHTKTGSGINETLTHVFGEESCLSFMEIIERIFKKLLEINKLKFSLELRRTILQFMNDCVGGNQCSSGMVQSKSEIPNQANIVAVCIFIIENTDMLLDNLPKISGYVHFGGHAFQYSFKETANNLVYDRAVTRKALLLILKSILMVSQAQKRLNLAKRKSLEHSLKSWLNCAMKTEEGSSQPSFPVLKTEKFAVALISLFSDQDDELMTLLLCLTNLYQELFLNECSFQGLEWVNHWRNALNVHQVFLEFLRSIHYDHSLLLDFLISNETCFLSYFSSYLRLMATDWKGFLEIVNKLDTQSEKSAFQVPAAQHEEISEENTIFENDHQVVQSSSLEILRHQGVTFGDCVHSENNGDRRSAIIPGNICYTGKTEHVEISSGNTSREGDQQLLQYSSVENNFYEELTFDDTSHSKNIGFTGNALILGSTGCTGNTPENKFSRNNTIFSENRSFVFHCYGENSRKERNFLDSYPRIEWNLGSYGNRVEVQEDVKEGVSVSSCSGLLAIKNDYGDLSSSDGDGDGNSDGDGHEKSHGDCQMHRGSGDNRRNIYSGVGVSGIGSGDGGDDGGGYGSSGNDYSGGNGEATLDLDLDVDCSVDDDNGSGHTIYGDQDHDDNADQYTNDGVRDNVPIIRAVVGTAKFNDEDHTCLPLLPPSETYLHKSLSCLIRLRFSIERMTSKNLFPYPVEALVKIIKYIESMYEGE